MDQTVFINDFISIGMFDFFNRNITSSFESHIVECLCDIYGKEDLKAIYESKDESAFTYLLFKYGLANNMYDNFLGDTLKYEEFKRENLVDPSVKSDIGFKVESTIITMFLYKCLLTDPQLEEISHFENDLLNNFEIIKLRFNTSISPNRIRDLWAKKKKMLTDSVELVELKPTYLDEATYIRFGTNLEDVKKMDYRMVLELNNYINSKIAVDSTLKEKKPKWNNIFRNAVLSSGNGFVDGLLLASIIATAISSTLIYIFLH